MPDPLEKSLNAEWVHSHEEDEGDRMVFRPADFDFPPSRGRTGFRLEPGGAAEASGPGPDDRRRGAPGRWSLSGRRLRVSAPGFSGTFEVEKVDGERLVVRRVEEER